MARYIYNKNRKVKIFKLISTRNGNGFEVITKKYIHPIDKYLKAYYKDLREKFSAQVSEILDQINA